MMDMQLCVLSDSELKQFDPSQYLEDYSLTEGGSYDVYFNLCDGSDNLQEDYDGIHIVRALEELQLPFPGANNRFYDPSREAMQQVAEANGIGFA